jgi:hypothetical protein
MYHPAAEAREKRTKSVFSRRENPIILVAGSLHPFAAKVGKHQPIHRKNEKNGDTNYDNP